MKVYLSELAENKLMILNEYLIEEWGVKVKNDFFNKLKSIFSQISKQPKSCTQSDIKKGIYKCVLTKQTTAFYRINFDKKEIEIITIFDTRQDPNKIKTEIK